MQARAAGEGQELTAEFTNREMAEWDYKSMNEGKVVLEDLDISPTVNGGNHGLTKDYGFL